MIPQILEPTLAYRSPIGVMWAGKTIFEREGGALECERSKSDLRGKKTRCSHVSSDSPHHASQTHKVFAGLKCALAIIRPHHLVLLLENAQ